MNKKLIGLAGMICLVAILAGCGQVTQSAASAQSKDDGQAAQAAPAVVSETEADSKEADAPVTETATEALPTEDTATKIEVELANDEVTVSEPIIELPKPQNQLSAGQYSWSQLLPRDAIYPVYEPQFAPAEDAPYADDELVIGVEINGEAKAYAIGPLNSREMVNDTLGGVPILVTW